MTALDIDLFFFLLMHTIKGFSIVNEAEVDVFLEFLCFFNDPVDAGNLISLCLISIKTFIEDFEESL